jgi:hypothetical protein
MARPKLPRWQTDIGPGTAPGTGCCPTGDRQFRCRHGWRARHLQDLPVQAAAVTLNLKVGDAAVRVAVGAPQPPLCR